MLDAYLLFCAIIARISIMICAGFLAIILVYSVIGMAILEIIADIKEQKKKKE